MEGFTRQEVIALSGAKPSDLNYWDRIGFLCPVKTGNPKRPECIIYSDLQTLQAAMTIKLKATIPLVVATKLVKKLIVRPDIEEVLSGCLLEVGDELVVERPRAVGVAVLSQLDQRNDVVVRRIGSFNNLLSEIRVNAERHGVLDFDKRVVGTVLEQKRVLAA